MTTKSRKPLNEADRLAAAEARAVKLDALHADLAEQVESLTTSEGWLAMLQAAARFRKYSMNNSMLIALQLASRGMSPDRVASFTTWKTLGRSVVKGEKGLAILAPCTYGRPAEEDPETGIVIKQPGRKVVHGFRVAYVFALSQTEGEDLPDLLGADPRLEGEAPAGLWDGLAEQVAAAGYGLERGDCGQAGGYSDPVRKVVRVRDSHSDAEACSVLAHELAHVLLHCNTGYDYAGHRGTAEIEAESIAYLVVTAKGLPSGSCATPYVAGWADGDVKKVKAAAERVVRTAHDILDRLDGIPDQAMQEDRSAA